MVECQTYKTRLWIALMLALVCLSVVQAAYYYPRLPDTVPSHFGPAGRPDGWMSKGGFCVLGVAVPLGFTILFAGVTLVMQAVGRKLSPTPDSEESARKMLARRQMGESMISFMLGCGTATILLMMVIIQMAIQANLTPPPVLRHGWLVLSVYLTVLAALVARVVIKYLRYERDHQFRWLLETLKNMSQFPFFDDDAGSITVEEVPDGLNLWQDESTFWRFLVDGYNQNGCFSGANQIG